MPREGFVSGRFYPPFHFFVNVKASMDIKAGLQLVAMVFWVLCGQSYPGQAELQKASTACINRLRAGNLIPLSYCRPRQ